MISKPKMNWTKDYSSHKSKEHSQETRTEKAEISLQDNNSESEWIRTHNRSNSKMRKRSQVRNWKMRRMKMTVTVISDQYPFIHYLIIHFFISLTIYMINKNIKYYPFIEHKDRKEQLIKHQ